jgi:uncharacterized membrane protein YcfT
VLIHHSLLNYTWFGNGDRMRWLGFDLMVLLNDSYFMAFMFLISGLFVKDGLVRKRPAIYLRDRAWRLGVPYLLFGLRSDADRLLSDVSAVSFARNDGF